MPAFVVFYWLGYNLSPVQLMNSALPGSAGQPMPQVLELNSRLIGLAGDVPSLVIVILALNTLRRLFFLYERGEFFKEENVTLYRALSRLAFWGILADIVNKSALTVALTINNPPGQRFLTVGFSGGHLKLMLIAIILMIIARVMNEGRKIYDENQLTV